MPRHQIIVTPDEGKEKWATQKDYAKALGLTEQRLIALQRLFDTNDMIDRTIVITGKAGKAIFAEQVRAWLEETLTDDDCERIYGRDNLGYEPGFAVFQAARYFKRKLADSERAKLKRRRQAAIPAAEMVPDIGRGEPFPLREDSEYTFRFGDSPAALRSLSGLFPPSEAGISSWTVSSSRSSG